MILKDMIMLENGYLLLFYVYGVVGIVWQVYECGDFDYYDLMCYFYYIVKEGEGFFQIVVQWGWVSFGFGGYLFVDYLLEWGVVMIFVGFNLFNLDVFSNNYVMIIWE